MVKLQQRPNNKPIVYCFLDLHRNSIYSGSFMPMREINTNQNETNIAIVMHLAKNCSYFA